MERYPTAVDWWLALILIASPLFCFGLGIYVLPDSTEGAIISILAGVFVAGLTALFLPCHYTLHSDNLMVRSGILKKKVRYADITEIKLSSCPLSSPALSLKRIRIEYAGRSILISPPNREAFIETLQSKVVEHRQ